MNSIIELSPSMRMEMRMEMRLDQDRTDTPSDFAQCARCGAWNKLIAHRADNGAVVWLQPTHRCADGVITEAL